MLCIHDLSPADCSFCSGRGEPVPEVHDKTKLGTEFAARYPGNCAWCEKRFGEGEIIRSDNDGGWVCRECSE